MITATVTKVNNMYNVTIQQAITNNDFGALKSLVNKKYHYAKIPTITKEQLENYKLSCINSGKTHLIQAFDKYLFNIYAVDDVV